MDYITLVFQIINIVILVAIVVAVSLMLYHGMKIIIYKSKQIDRIKSEAINNKNQK